MTSVLKEVLAKAEVAEKNGLKATAIKLYQQAQRNAWNNAGGSKQARDAIKRIKAKK